MQQEFTTTKQFFSCFFTIIDKYSKKYAFQILKRNFYNFRAKTKIQNALEIKIFLITVYKSQ